jgi:hypothetical protein
LKIGESRFDFRQDIGSLLHHFVQIVSGAILLSYPLGMRAVSLGVKRVGRGAGHVPPTAEVNSAWNNTSTPTYLMTWSVLKHEATLPHMKQKESHSLVHFNAYVFRQEAKWRASSHSSSHLILYRSKTAITPASAANPRHALVGEVAVIARRNVIREISLSQSRHVTAGVKL